MERLHTHSDVFSETLPLIRILSNLLPIRLPCHREPLERDGYEIEFTALDWLYMESGKGRDIDNCHVFGLGDWVDGIASLGGKGHHSKNNFNVLHFEFLGNIQKLILESS